jgi:hypothetical protein
MRNFQKGTKSHIELPKMHKIPWGTYKSAQNPTRNIQKCTKSQEKLPNMHKIPRGSSKMYTIPRGTPKYTQSHEELPKMHKIPGKTSKYVRYEILCIIGSSSWDFFAFSEVPRGVLFIIRSQSW